MTLRPRRATRPLVAASSLVLATLLSGCAFSNSTPAKSTTTTPTTYSLQGRVHGGQQPVSNATIQLYAVGNTGAKSASTALLTQSVLTDNKGGFNITGLWDCTNTALYGTDPLLYLVATGGDSGSGINPAISMMVAIGRCSTLTPQSFLFVNEVSTVSAVYALSPFMSDYRHIGASTANMAGLGRAFDTVGSLVSLANGTSPGPSAVAGETVPIPTINSLANSIASCINSVSGGACATLFAATTPTSGAAPTETIAALQQIASTPLRNVSAIFNLSAGVVPFQPQLFNAPSDWTLALTFSGSGLNYPGGLALDAGGNVWAANAGGNSITGLTSQGVPLTGTGGYTAGGTIFGAQAIAVDRTGNVWVADTLLSSVFKLTVTNNAIASSARFTSAVSGPAALAVDGGNRVWVANFAEGSVTALSNDGTPINGSPLTASNTLQAPDGIAIDTGNNVWVTDNSTSLVARFDNHGTLLSGAGYTDNALLAPTGIAFDSAGRAWVAGNGNAAISLFASNGASAFPTPLSGGSLTLPTSVAIDGADVVWLASGTPAGSLTQIPPGASAVVGGISTLNAPSSVAIDASGNIWTANSGNDTISKIIGAATPVTTPLAANLPAIP